MLAIKYKFNIFLDHKLYASEWWVVKEVVYQLNMTSSVKVCLHVQKKKQSVNFILTSNVS